MISVREVAVRLQRRRVRSGPLAPDVCRAPFTSMYLDQHGSVRACCQNSEYPLGNVTKHRLREIWEGEQARLLRQAMLDHDLDRGCAFCKWQAADGNDGLVFARTFDHLRAESTMPAWPRQLELSMSNACNLQCVMCNGDWSSSIRANREGRPPLPQVYDDTFFEDLRPFLEHVEVVKILGGEPFLGKESLRVMEMLIEMGSKAEVHVTTNGTQWTTRVQRIVEQLPMVIVVSLDGIDKAGYEAIRIGSDHEVVLENIDRFRGYAAEHGTSVHLAHCLMATNWEQFPDFLRYAEGRELSTYVNTVTHPTSLSLFHLPSSKLRKIIEVWEAENALLEQELRINLGLWRDQLGRLRHRLAGIEGGQGVDYYLGVQGFPLLVAGAGSGSEAALAYAAAIDPSPPTHLRLDIDHRILGVQSGPSELVGVDVRGLEGRDLDSLLAALGEAHGNPVVSSPAVEHAEVRQWRLTFPDGQAPIAIFRCPIRDEEGVITEFAAYIVVEPTVGAVAPPSVEDLRAELRALRPAGSIVVIGADGRITDVDPQGRDLRRVLGGATGITVQELLGRLADTFGDLEEMSNEPLDKAMRYSLRFLDGRGRGTRLEALALTAPTDGFGDAGTVVTISALA